MRQGAPLNSRLQLGSACRDGAPAAANPLAWRIASRTMLNASFASCGGTVTVASPARARAASITCARSPRLTVGCGAKTFASRRRVLHPLQSSASNSSSVTGQTADTGSGGWSSIISGRALSASW
jgi:hypothetical protein